MQFTLFSFYIIHITRFVIGFIFLFSFFMKLRDPSTFETTVKNFQILPNNLHRGFAFLLMFCEALIGVSSLLGESWLFLSYILAILLLTLFIYALNSVLQREIQASCNCFGANEKSVSQHDILRNVAIIVVSCVGLIALISNNGFVQNLNLVDTLLMGTIAMIFSLLLLKFREFLEIID